MKYITGKQALEIQFMRDNGGASANPPDFTQLTLENTEDSLLGSYGIETGFTVPQHDGTFAVADTVRALIDLIVSCRFSEAEGFRQQPYWHESLMPELFYRVWVFYGYPMWEAVATFLWQECGKAWRLWNLAFDPVNFRSFTNELIRQESYIRQALGATTDENTVLSKSRVFFVFGDIHDLRDLTEICLASRNNLTDEEKESVRDALRRNGTTQFDFLIHAQPDICIDVAKLARQVLQVCDLCGLSLSDELRREIREFTAAQAA